ncbi:YncE family protein [Chitinophaga sp. Hz27]|uniref:YncE family protein n=1 Tax=Chitinophaga sp. Hz27 TaxID=3347169 RepID=UPI0035D71E7D
MMIQQLRKLIPLTAAMLALFAGCRKGDKIVPSTPSTVTDPVPTANPSGFYLLNEGNMGSNKATLDYMDYTTGIYHKNIYAEVNPNVVKELGDVGNDVQIYGNKLYAVINVSNKIEVMDATTTKRIKQVDILNCRYVVFANGKAYVSSYAGPVQIDVNAPIGFVAEVDTTTLEVTRKVIVGYQPEEMAVVNNKLYVANSGGYRVPNYDSTVSVIDLNTFTEIKKINVGINLHRLRADAYGDIYVSSRGDYNKVASALYRIDTKTDQVVQQFKLPVSDMWISGDTAYVYGSAFSYNTNSFTVSYNMLNVKTESILNKNFITDGTESQIKMPYAIAVNPNTKEILVGDAKDYVSPGKLFCFDKNGKLRWSVITGDIPAHITFFTGKKIN